ncbi:MAG: hypothetical protein FJ368_01190 [Pelagibacterales bacterium]|nr:hypothetical protein [Pelagibacterales bacterium]
MIFGEHNSFDVVYILNLHGSSRKEEVCPNGLLDQNVFDIMQGVSINIFVKTGKKKSNVLGKVFHYDLWGSRNYKYDFLSRNSLKTLNWEILEYKNPNYFFVKKNNDNADIFESYLDLKLLFVENSMGIATGRDSELVSMEENDILGKFSSSNKFYYRPFDIRHTIFDNNVLQRARFKLMNNYILGKNIGLNIVRQSKLKGTEALISDNITNRDFITNHTYNFPLYLYHNTFDQSQKRTPNLNQEIVTQIAEKLNLTFTNEKEEYNNTFAPIDILDYTYAVLHSPNYREKYKEFLKIDFPRVPYPKDQETFWKLVDLGGSLRKIHLLESSIVEQYLTTYPTDGSNIVDKIVYEDGKVFINPTQHFSGVPQVAWEFYIGGYQPAQKWLKDRKGRKLEFDDILYYQKIIVALSETDRLMKEIDKIILQI